MVVHGQASMVNTLTRVIMFHLYLSGKMVHGQSQSSCDACDFMAGCQLSILLVRDRSGLLNALQYAITRGGTGAIIARRSALSVVNGQSEDMLQYIVICNHA